MTVEETAECVSICRDLSDCTAYVSVNDENTDGHFCILLRGEFETKDATKYSHHDTTCGLISKNN
jgi:hypothetical protein